MAGANVRVRFAPVPERTMFPKGIRDGLEDAALTVRLAAAVSASAIEKISEPVEASSLMVWFAPAVKVGASLTALTVIVNDCEALVATGMPLSLSVTVIVADPLAFGLA